MNSNILFQNSQSAMASGSSYQSTSESFPLTPESPELLSSVDIMDIFESEDATSRPGLLSIGGEVSYGC